VCWFGAPKEKKMNTIAYSSCFALDMSPQKYGHAKNKYVSLEAVIVLLGIVPNTGMYTFLWYTTTSCKLASHVSVVCMFCNIQKK
jgi:hypothetical protein